MVGFHEKYSQKEKSVQSIASLKRNLGNLIRVRGCDPQILSRTTLKNRRIYLNKIANLFISKKMFIP